MPGTGRRTAANAVRPAPGLRVLCQQPDGIRGDPTGQRRTSPPAAGPCQPTRPTRAAPCGKARRALRDVCDRRGPRSSMASRQDRLTAAASNAARLAVRQHRRQASGRSSARSDGPQQTGPRPVANAAARFPRPISVAAGVDPEHSPPRIGDRRDRRNDPAERTEHRRCTEPADRQADAGYAFMPAGGFTDRREPAFEATEHGVDLRATPGSGRPGGRQRGP